MKRTTCFAVFGVLLLVGVAVSPVAAEEDGGALFVDVTQEGVSGDVTVIVTDVDDIVVENATVTVTVEDENVTYDGTGEYTTDENGTAVLPEPSETVEVTVEVTHANETASVTKTLTASEPGDDLSIGVQQGAERVTIAITENGTGVENASVSVRADRSWNETGDYVTDGDGYVVLSGPERTVNATIEATVGDRYATSTVELTGSEGVGPTEVPFGMYVSAFIHALGSGDSLEKPLGHYVSALASGTNPSVDRGGPPAWLTGTDREPGPPAHAGGPSDDDERGPPAHAGGPSDDDERGPPNNANG